MKTPKPDREPLPAAIDVTLCTATQARVAGPGGIVREMYILVNAQFPERLSLLAQRDANSPYYLVGSITNIRRITGSFVGVARFSRSRFGQQTLADVVDGHLTELLLATRPQTAHWVQPEDLRAKVTTPLRVITQWYAAAVLIPAIGGDAGPRFRNFTRGGFDLGLPADDTPLDPEWLQIFRSKGMPRKLDGREAFRWINRNLAVKPPQSK